MDAFSPIFQDEEAARDYFERLRWPNGPVCLHCGNDGSQGRVSRIAVKSSRRRLYKCYAKACRKQFSLTQGTIFQGSHVSVRMWLFAIYRMSASKKGISAFQLHREMGITAKTAWFMCHRIRYAMADESMIRLLTAARAEDVSEADKLGGIVEADEVYLGPRRMWGVGGHWRKHKTAVMTLVEREGRARSFVMSNVSQKTIRQVLDRHVKPSAMLMTDGHPAYVKPGKRFARHETVDHLRREYARGIASVNAAESYFSLLRRGVTGTFHHISSQHLPRYLAEFDFRHDTRKITDGERAAEIMQRTEGKRLMYRSMD